MADNSGFPHCTKWKNYRYPMTRLTQNTHYTIESATGYFSHPSGVRYLDIWVSDDWFLHSDSLGATYKVVMQNSSADRIVKLHYPQAFYDGGTGTKENDASVVAGKYFAQLNTTDSQFALDVASSTSSLIGSTGNNQSVYPIIPGLHFGFRHTGNTGFAANDEFSWTMNSNVLDGIPKIQDNTYTCWLKSPKEGGDTVVTEPLPSGIGNQNLTILYNANNHPPKFYTADNWGISLYVEGSVDKVNWFNVRQMIDDSDTIGAQACVWDSNAGDGDDFPYKRFKIEFPTGGDTGVMNDDQWIQLAITPN